MKIFLSYELCFLACLGWVPAPPWCNDGERITGQAQTASGSGAASDHPELWDGEISVIQQELLASAFQVARAIPLNPHIKDRAKAQEEVVAVCLELGLFARAETWIQEIPNWRRGAAYADLAFALAKAGRESMAMKYLDLAYQVVEETWGDDSQDWHRDRIRAKIARTYMLLGRGEEANLFGANLVDSEAIQLTIYRSELVEIGDEEYAANLASLQAAITAGVFDTIRMSATILLKHFEFFYANEERRAEMLAYLDLAWPKIPLNLRLEYVLELGNIAVKHGDQVSAMEFVEQGKQLIGQATWRTEDEIAVRGKFAALTFESGNQKQAQEEVDKALGFYELVRIQMESADRANALRPLAEAYFAIGDQRGTQLTYRRALEEGMENPNFRPRAEDFVATCCSMVRNGLELEEELLGSLRRARTKLLEAP